MTIQDYQQRYQGDFQKYQNLLKKVNALAVIRFVLFLLILFFLLYGYFQHVSFLYGISFICLIAFMIIVQYHQKIKNQMLIVQSLCEIEQQHIDRILGQWDTFLEDGSTYLKENDEKAMDLDILGHHSLFQMINVSHTQRGKALLANVLKNGLPKDDIFLYQQAVKEISQHHNFCFYMEAYGQLLKKKDEDHIDSYLKTIKNISVKPMLKIVHIVSLLTIIALIAVCFQIAYPMSQIILEIGFVSQIIFVIFFMKSHQSLFEPLAALEKSLKSYMQMFVLLENETFESDLLLQLQDQLLTKNQVIKGIQELCHIASLASMRQNVIAWILFNGFGMYDFILRNRYLKWIETYTQDMNEWFDQLAIIELCMSLSVVKRDGFQVCMPTIQETKTLSFRQLKHPLILPQKAVGNDFSYQHSVCMITGSNMSGKTTFMRTIGLNLVLAYAGGYVFGESFNCSYMHILTSMRVRDNVEEGISTFYGELLRIKKMIEWSQTHQPMICFIDEIFKGTNSLDRIAGAKATIAKLYQPQIIAFLTTHDFDLCEIDGYQLDNYHFDEDYKDSKIYFDYCIKKGRSQTTNGQFLLKQLGIMEEDE